uniref:Uncharacterized protein n=1 Tax=Romanomermis culicivorax TaxID=13658 RepID=A0A915HNC2_ROMCU
MPWFNFSLSPFSMTFSAVLVVLGGKKFNTIPPSTTVAVITDNDQRVNFLNFLKPKNSNFYSINDPSKTDDASRKKSLYPHDLRAPLHEICNSAYFTRFSNHANLNWNKFQVVYAWCGRRREEKACFVLSFACLLTLKTFHSYGSGFIGTVIKNLQPTHRENQAMSKNLTNVLKDNQLTSQGHHRRDQLLELRDYW